MNGSELITVRDLWIRRRDFALKVENWRLVSGEVVGLFALSLEKACTATRPGPWTAALQHPGISR